MLLQAEDQAHLVTGSDHIIHALGGLTNVWRFDRMATVAARCRPPRFPAVLSLQRRVSAQALVAYRGHSYSMPPELAHTTVSVLVRLGETCLDIAAPAGVVIARDRPALPGAGIMVRDHAHITALNTEAANAATSTVAHRSKVRIPPTRHHHPSRSCSPAQQTSGRSRGDRPIPTSKPPKEGKPRRDHDHNR